jgi:V8-like Glu-specific endopeptidase
VLTAYTTSDWASMQWVSFDLITATGESDAPCQLMEVAHHLAPGNSGGPVWIRWEERRNLIGIAQSCEPGSNANAVRITNHLLNDIESWMKQ